MQPGVKPRPTALKILEGSDRYINENEPKPAPLKPIEPPEYIPEIVRGKYKQYAGKLIELNILKETDELTFNLMFLHLGLALEAGKTLKEEELTNTDNRRVKRKNPHLQILRDNSLAYLRYATLFGLDPSSRSRIITDEIDPEDLIEQLITGNTGRKEDK